MASIRWSRPCRFLARTLRGRDTGHAGAGWAAGRHSLCPRQRNGGNPCRRAGTLSAASGGVGQYEWCYTICALARRLSPCSSILTGFPPRRLPRCLTAPEYACAPGSIARRLATERSAPATMAPLRVGFSVFNQARDVDMLVHTLRQIQREYHPSEPKG